MGEIKKQGWILIGITAAFFCLLLGVFIGRGANKSYIHIQDVQDAASTPTQSQHTSPVSPGKININTATSEQLQLLNGIGKTIAQQIIDYRETNGGFTTIDELMNVSGIGPKKFDSIKDYITVN